MKIIDDLPKDYGGPPTVPLDSPGMARASFDLASSGSKATKSGTHPLKLRSDTPTRQRKLRDK
jgi:hypothetical protein